VNFIVIQSETHIECGRNGYFPCGRIPAADQTRVDKDELESCERLM
jgi:hypothetical protein